MALVCFATDKEPGLIGETKHVLWQFLRNIEPLNDDREVDAMIKMDVGEGLEQSLSRAIDDVRVVRMLVLPHPDVECVGV